MLLIAAASFGTGTLLLLGYLLAAFSTGVIAFIMARKMVKQIADARPALRHLLRAPADIP
jgi:hypothetical protein